MKPPSNAGHHSLSIDRLSTLASRFPSSRLGLALGTFVPPAQLIPLARLGEELGFEEIWVTDDFWYTSGVAAMSAVLASTRRARVGLGVTSAVVRHPAVLATEAATLEGMYPGRPMVGIGLGVPDSLRRMKLYPRSPLGAVRNCVETTRALLAGESRSADTPVFGMRDVRLSYPPAGRVPIYVGASGPRMLGLSGEIADGTLLSFLSPVSYLRWACERIEEGRAAGGATRAHHKAALALLCVDDDRAAARAALRPLLALDLAAQAESPAVQLEHYGIADEVRALAGLSPARIEAAIPDQWVDDIAIVGRPEDCAAAIDAHLEAGVETLALMPFPADRAEAMVQRLAYEIVPRLVAPSNATTPSARGGES